jgi:hypothetical protein
MKKAQVTNTKRPGATTKNKYCAFFSHPDFTVGFGIAPNQPPKRVADYTAGWESHPAPKNHIFTKHHVII